MKKLIALALALSLLLGTCCALADDPVPVKKITLSPTEFRLPIGKTFLLKSTVSPTKATDPRLTWASSDETVATVRGGYVTGVGEGTADITATSRDGTEITAMATVTVYNAVTTITLSEKSTFSMAPRTSWRIAAEVEPADATNTGLVWSSSNEQVAVVEQDGIVTALSAGDTRITVDAADGSGTRATVGIRVKDYDAVFVHNEPQEVTFPYRKGTLSLRMSSRNGCVTAEAGDDIPAQPTGDGEGTLVLTPVKAGEDYVSLSTGQKSLTYRVFVSPEAFPELESSPRYGMDENGEIRFLEIPWNSSWEEAKAVLNAQGITPNAIGKRTGYLRSVITEPVPFFLVTAFNAALNFHYSEDDYQYESNNSFFKGDFYFEPDVPLEDIQLSVRQIYGTDSFVTDGDVCTWQKGKVKLVLTRKERFTILEITRN